MNYNRFLNPVKDGDLVYLLRSIHNCAVACKSVSLASGTPAPETFPLAGVTFTTPDGEQIHAGVDEMQDMLPYQSAEGHQRLIEWAKKISKYYHDPPIFEDGNEEKRFDVCITGGAMGAMHLLFSQIIENNEVVLSDEHIFGGSICCFKRAGAVLLGVSMDDQGITPEALRDALDNWKTKALENCSDKDAHLKTPKMLYTIPTGQNPTGVLVGIQRKKEIYKIAQEYDLLIVEDDPYYFLQYDEKMTPSYQSIDVDGRVLRIDSMSKFIAPGIRVGWLSGPSAIVKRIVDAQTTDTMAASCLSQLALIKLFDSWGMEGIKQRVKYLQTHYKPKKDAAEKALQKYLSDVAEWYQTKAGVFIWLKLKEGKDSMFFADLDLSKKYKVYAVPGIDFSCNGKSGVYFRLSFSGLSVEEFEEGIRRLSKLIKEALNDKNYKLNVH